MTNLRHQYDSTSTRLQQPSEIKIFSNHISVLIITLGLPKEKGDLYHMIVNSRPFEHFIDQEYIVCFPPIPCVNSRFWASLNPKEVTTNSLGREFFQIHPLWKCSGLTGACVFVLGLSFCKAWRAKFIYRTCRYHRKWMNLDEFRWGLAWSKLEFMEQCLPGHVGCRAKFAVKLMDFKI